MSSDTQGVLDAFDAYARRTQQQLEAKSSGVMGHVFGPSSQTLAAVASVINSGKRGLAALAAKVDAGDADLDQLVDAERGYEGDVADTVGFAVESSLDDVLRKTAVQTGQDVAHVVNEAASVAGSFAWNAIPWWVWAGGAAFVAWRIGLLGPLATRAGRGLAAAAGART